MLLHACASHAPREHLPANAGPLRDESTPAQVSGALVKAPVHDGLFLPRSVEEAGPQSRAPRRRIGAAFDGPAETEFTPLGMSPRLTPRLESPDRLGADSAEFGQDFLPAQGLRAYKVKGMASWYGKRFHGGRTASGETYDMFAMSAAHLSLPIPSYARVTNLANGRSVVVRVNDRGPFHTSRVMDLSYAAAYKLGFADRGMAEVEIEPVIPPAGAAALPAAKAKPARGTALAQATSSSKPSSTTKAESSAPAATPGEPPLAVALAETDGPATPAAGSERKSSGKEKGISLQLGVFAKQEHAESLRGLVQKELAWVAGKLTLLNREGRYRLHLGPYRDAGEAKPVLEALRASLNLAPMIVAH